MSARFSWRGPTGHRACLSSGMGIRSGMTRYRNRSGNSGVVAYALGKDSITLEFETGGVYEYTADSAGRTNIDRMNALAVDGRGLAAFVARNVRERYARKLS
jgi:hypothetical protein